MLFSLMTETDLKTLTNVVRFEDPQSNSCPFIPFDGTPFIIVGKKVMVCHQGKDREKNRKERRKRNARQKGDHTFSRTRRIVQPTKKKDCPVQIKIRHIIKFPDFKVGDECSKFYARDAISTKLKDLISRNESVRFCHRYHVNLPDPSEHRNHFQGETASLSLSMDGRLKDHLRKMVWENNITSGPQMKIMLEVYMKDVIFSGNGIPPRTNKRFWPSNKDIQNHIALALKKQRHSNIDQEIVADLVQQWKTRCPSDLYFLRLKNQCEDKSEEDIDKCMAVSGDDDSEEDVLLRQPLVANLYGGGEKFLFVHQTEWQRRLLIRYGQEISLLDAAYRTTRYSLPLYFLCVPTNVGYITVASFITETEDSESLKEALHILKKWNPMWAPRYFMCDYAEEEINSLENVFPEYTKEYLAKAVTREWLLDSIS